MNKLMFGLDRIRVSLESAPPPQIMPANVVINIVSIESGRYVTKTAMDRLASDEPLSSIPPSELLKPLEIEHEAKPSAEVIELRNAYLKQAAEAETGRIEAPSPEEARRIAELEALPTEELARRAGELMRRAVEVIRRNGDDDAA